VIAASEIGWTGFDLGFEFGETVAPDSTVADLLGVLDPGPWVDPGSAVVLASSAALHAPTSSRTAAPHARTSGRARRW
jgi:hypothetical protein